MDTERDQRRARQRAYRSNSRIASAIIEELTRQAERSVRSSHERHTDPIIVDELTKYFYRLSVSAGNPQVGQAGFTQLTYRGVPVLTQEEATEMYTFNEGNPPVINLQDEINGYAEELVRDINNQMFYGDGSGTAEFTGLSELTGSSSTTVTTTYSGTTTNNGWLAFSGNNNLVDRGTG